MTTIFLDLDGVLADFDRHVADLFGDHPATLEDEGRLWSSIETLGETYWRTMPRTVWFDQLMRRVIETRLPFVVLTGTPRTDRIGADRGKRAWVAANLGPSVPVITGPSREKKSHIREDGDLLIDDRPSNCASWRAAGGRAVFWNYHTPFRSLARAADVLRGLTPAPFAYVDAA